MSIMTVTTRISHRYLERKSKSELARIIMNNIDRIDLFKEPELKDQLIGQTAARCAEIVLEAKRHYEDEDCTLTMNVGLESIAEDIRLEFALLEKL